MRERERERERVRETERARERGRTISGDHTTSLDTPESKQVSVFISIKPRSVFCSDGDKMYKL